MPSPPDAPGSLLDLQREFARAMLQPSASVVGVEAFSATRPPATASRLDVYRNNARQFFRGALELTYPVLRRRVGDGYFRQLVDEYRAAHPSRRGDLHWAGAAFPDWLAGRLVGTEYEWLGDLARLEWLCEESMASGREPSLTLQDLASVPADRIDGMRVRLQPSVRSMSSRYPVCSVWQANQDETSAAPVDLAQGEEHCAIACLDERVIVYHLQPAQGRLLETLLGGATLAGAVEQAGVEADTLAALLGWACREDLVVEFSPSAPA